MKSEQIIWRKEPDAPKNQTALAAADLVFVFGSPELLSDQKIISAIRDTYPLALFTGCSTAGEIHSDGVLEGTLITTAVKFNSTKIKIFYARFADENESYKAGQALAQQISPENLKHLFVLSDGIHVNGSLLTKGISESLPANVRVTGGLAADGDRFSKTFVLGPVEAEEKLVSAVAFYGSNLGIQSGSLGGWDPFGPERIVSKAAGSVVYELDGKPILELYKTYLGEHAAGLPASALLFPLSVRISENGEYLVRTVLGIDEAASSMRFAGDIPQGARVRLMKANFNRLVDGAGKAAEFATQGGKVSPGLALLISCVGRKLVLKQRTEEEVDAVREIMGEKTRIAGFYSYGEISPVNGFMECSLHNQTMTVTTYDEIE
jgi:hypothetical protein